MNKKALVLLSCAVVFLAAACRESMPSLTERVFRQAESEYVSLDSYADDANLPGSIKKDGSFQMTKPSGWTSGFFPGCLWYVYEYTGSEKIKKLAWKNTLKLEPILDPAKDVSHDIGFMVNCSYGNAYRLTGDAHAREALEAGAAKLAARFNPVVGCTRSWNDKDPRVFKVIIDNMMNLEILMVGHELFGADSLKSIALTHANTTIANHFRPDGSTWHLVIYDSFDGSVTKKQTVQGFADDSAWSRGQAWGLYGYTMMYEKTGERAYLEQAEKMAAYVIPHLPKDGVPYWDFNAPGTPEALPMDAPGHPKNYNWQPGDKIERDASAGAIMASALVSLSRLADEPGLSKRYMRTAEKIIRSLASPEYLSAPGENYGFLVKHCVVNLNGNSGVDVPLPYADYYFLEALLKYRSINQ